MPVRPTYPGVYIEEISGGVRAITGVATSVTAFIGRARRGPLDDPITIDSFADFERVFGGLWEQSALGYAVRDFYLNGGSRAIIVRVFRPPSDDTPITKDDFTGDEKQANQQGLYALEKADLFNLLCIPPYLATGDVDAQLWDEAAEYCVKRRAMLIVDSPSGWKGKDDAKKEIGNLGTSSKNAAVYFPRLRQPNPLRDDRKEDFAPSGAIAGVFARTDAARGVWKAPAGPEATLVGVAELTVQLTDAETGELNPLGINCLRCMPPGGCVIWGARTLQGDDRLASEWKYIPVRRTALFLEESLYRGTRWAVFEPNDEPLWAQIRLNVGNFLNGLFRQGAFQGQTPAEAYFVKCDEDTTTPTDRDLGRVNIVVGFAPLKPAEFVIIRIQQLAGQIDCRPPR